MSIKTLYIVHHSHTDIGYTDLQERVVSNHVEFIRQAVRLLSDPKNEEFRWNCETLYCVEQYLNSVSAKEQKAFFELVRAGRIGVSASWLNMNDLADKGSLSRKTAAVVKRFAEEGLPLNTAMIADINGISMGNRDVLIENGVEFFFTNIHTHHGMYPLFQNQNAYYWENEEGKRLLIWNGEHYNLGNGLGIIPVPTRNYFGENYFGQQLGETPLEKLHHNLSVYRKQCEDAGYAYDFLVTSVSGVFSDNAPPNPEAARMVKAYNEAYDDIRLQMVSLPELYAAIRDKIADAPVYRGDLTDWWANGIGSTPYAVKHYREAQQQNRLCDRLEQHNGAAPSPLREEADENLLLYSEHTWGHSSTITNPYDTMVINLDMRKNSYASKAHEAAAKRLCALTLSMGGSATYYNVDGRVRAISTAKAAGSFPVEFYVETGALEAAEIKNQATGEILPCQVSGHPRGRLISFIDHFEPGEGKCYTYRRTEKRLPPTDTRHTWIGAERVKDIVNDVHTEDYGLPECVENEWLRLRFEVGKGVLSVYDKKAGRELLVKGKPPFLTPVYECTEILTDVYEERRRLGRNMRGRHAKQYIGELTDISLLEQGEVFLSVRLTYRLEGTRYCDVVLKLYRKLPRLEYQLRMAKTMTEAVESVYLPLTLSMEGSELWTRKGDADYRPGIDQLPGTCIDFTVADRGLALVGRERSILIGAKDVPMVYLGALTHHQIKLFDPAAPVQAEEVYSWVMNNNWETNFKMDLSGCCEFGYSLVLADGMAPGEALSRLEEGDDGVTAFILDDELQYK